jgi:diguanylate cyclase (GGDEF)-like protein/PAS domain S-box-containing protein
VAGGVAMIAALVLVDSITGPASPHPLQRVVFGAEAAWLFLLSGASLWVTEALDDRRARIASLLMAAIVVGVAATIGLFHPGIGTSPHLSTAFVAIGLSVMTLDWEPRRGFRPAQVLALLASMTAMTSLVGYVYDAPSLYSIGALPAISIHEATALLALSLAVLSARPGVGVLRVVTSDTAGGVLARSAPLAVVAVPMLLGWLALQGLRRSYYTEETSVALLVLGIVAFFAVLLWTTARSLDRSDRLRSVAEDALRVRSRQRAGVAALGQRALSGVALPVLVDSSVRLIGESLPVAWGDFIAADSIALPDARDAERPDLVDRQEPALADSPVLQVFSTGRPLIVDDLPRSGLFADADLVARGVVSAVLVPIQDMHRPYGVLAAYSPKPAAFTDEDAHWLQTVAGVLSTTLERRKHEDALRLSESKFSGLFRSSPDAMIVSDVAGGAILEVNDGFLEVTGFSRQEVIGRTLHELGVWPALAPDAREGNAPDREAPAVRNLEVRFRARSGDERLGLCSREPVMVADRSCVLTVVRDVTDMRRVQEQMEAANARLTRWVDELEARSREISLLNDMGDLLQTCLTSAEASAIAAQFARQLIAGSRGAIYVFGDGARMLSAAATWGSDPASAVPFIPEQCWALRRGRAYAVTGAEVGLACNHVRARGRAYLCVPMMAQGEALGVLHVMEDAPGGGSAHGAWLDQARQRLIVAVAEHVGLALANLALRERLHVQSVRDPLTGLYNRRFMEESLGVEIARGRRSSLPVALMLFDLDHFKRINDSFGHQAGDAVLVDVARLFTSRLRTGDVVCRFGGEEFLFLLPGMTLAGATARAEEIRRAVHDLELRADEHAVGPMTASVGVAVYPDHGETADVLLRAADSALYRAKANGRDRVEIAVWHSSVRLSVTTQPL